MTNTTDNSEKVQGKLNKFQQAISTKLALLSKLCQNRLEISLNFLLKAAEPLISILRKNFPLEKLNWLKSFRKQKTVITDVSKTEDIFSSPLPKQDNIPKHKSIFQGISHWFPSPTLEEKKQKTEQKIRGNLWLWRLLTLILIWIWFAGLAIIFGLFPYTRPLGLWLLYKPRLLLALWLTLFVVNKLMDIALGWILNTWTEQQILTQKAVARQRLRLKTLKRALGNMNTTLIIGIGIFLSLSIMGIPIFPVLAGAGIVGLALSFGAQDIIKSLVLGILFLITDSLAVGDWIVAEDAEGWVEEANLLYARIRSPKGILFTIPYNKIDILQNHTKDWSQVDYTVEVSYETDVDRALSLFEQVAQELHDDPHWSKSIIAPPRLFGVEEISHQGIKMRLLLRTQAGDHFMVNRELRRRVKIAFDREGIAIGIPKQYFLMQNSVKKE